MPSSKPAQRLHDIIYYADRIEQYTANISYAEFSEDTMRLHAVERCLQCISEAAVKLEDPYVQAWPEMELDKLRSLGNFMRHQYDDVATLVVWNLITDRLGPLRDAAANRLAELEDRASSGSQPDDNEMGPG